MANIGRIIDYMLSNEDPKLIGKVIVDNNGARARFGINEKFHADLTSQGFFDGMSHDDALALARTVYVNEYCKPLMCDQIVSDEMAAKFLDIAVNAGVSEAVRLMQRSLNYQSGLIVEDGVMGAKTLDAINHMPVEVWRGLIVIVLERFRQAVRMAGAVHVSTNDAMAWMARDARFPNFPTEVTT